MDEFSAPFSRLLDLIVLAIVLALAVATVVAVITVLQQPSKNCIAVGYDYGDSAECTKVCDDGRKISIPWSVTLGYDPETVCELGY